MRKSGDKKQIDIVAINDNTIILIECKSSEKSTPAKLLKDEFDLLSVRLDGFKKALWQIFGRNKRIKYIFATRNLRIPQDSVHLERLEKNNAFSCLPHWDTQIKNQITFVLICVLLLLKCFVL